MSLSFIVQAVLLVYVVGLVTLYGLTGGMCLLIGPPPKEKRLGVFVGPAIWPIMLVVLIVKDIRKSAKEPPRPRYHGLRYKNWQW